MRIIAGKLKGRHIYTVKEGTYRPTTGMIKEAIFSIISSGQFLNADTGVSVLQGAHIIDLFGGTGNLSFEALSRGASKATIIEQDPLHSDLLKFNTDKLGFGSEVKILRADATHLPNAPEKCSVAFIDPPFNKSLVRKCVQSLISKQWLETNAILVIRTHLRDEYDIDDLCNKLLSRQYSKSLLSIYKYI